MIIFKYEYEKVCDGCDEKKMTRQHIGLDPRRADRINFICKKCDKSEKTIPKILNWNKKNLPETHNIFGLALTEKNYKIKVYVFQ